MFDLTGQQVLLRAVAMLVIVGTHGFFFAALAVLLGDKGPRYDGRLSFNPMRHIEPVGALILVIFRVGWIRPVAVDVNELGGRLLGVLAIIIGSLLLTIVVAEVLWLLRPVVVTNLPDSSLSGSLVLILETTARISVWFAVVNLIPLPPLTAGLLLAAVAPDLYRFLDGKRVYVAIGLAAIAFAGAATDVLDPAVSALEDLVLR